MPTSSVPKLQFTPAGVVIPAETDIFAAVIADMSVAFGGGLSQKKETPQGQMATSESAIIADKNAEVANIVNQVDPQFSSGRFQDAIARIYYLTRKPTLPTTVIATLGGTIGAVIPAGTLAQDTSGNIYISMGTVTIPVSGSIDVEFQNVVTGPISCAAGTLIRPYQFVSGWDTITNATDGTLGNVVENRQEFEFRRKNSVALNARGSPQSVYAAVFNVDDVVDVYVLDNPESPISFTASIAATTMTVTAIVAGRLVVGAMVDGAGVTAGTYITDILTGTGGIGTYEVNNSQAVASEPMITTATVKGASEYALALNSIYVAAVGGTDVDVANAIITKKDFGCAYNGNTTVVVTDDSYSTPKPSYSVTFERPAALPILFAVQIVDDPSLPSDIIALVKAAIIARFNGIDGTQRERIGSTIYASKYYAPVSAVGDNVAVESVLIGTVTATLTKVTVGIDQHPTISASDIAVTLV